MIFFAFFIAKNYDNGIIIAMFTAYKISILSKRTFTPEVN
jgi:hypothetical protein